MTKVTLHAKKGKKPSLRRLPYNDGMSLEALHTTYVLMDTFERHVAESRCAKKYRDVAAKAEAAHQALFDLYQLIGCKF
jgi:hypothetical protein